MKKLHNGLHSSVFIVPDFKKCNEVYCSVCKHRNLNVANPYFDLLCKPDYYLFQVLVLSLELEQSEIDLAIVTAR